LSIAAGTSPQQREIGFVLLGNFFHSVSMPLSRDSDLDGHLSPVLCGLQHPSEAEELQ